MGNGNMVLGDVVCIHVDEAVMRDGRVAPDLLKPVGRLGGAGYTAAAKGIFELHRPTWDEVKDGTTKPPTPG